jgi:hypothetical protein
MALSIASVVAGLVLIGLVGEFFRIVDAAVSPDLAGPVVIILGLLVVGVVYGLRPWSDT